MPPRYCLSGKACRGILYRADKRGKVLPKCLRDILEYRASQANDEPIENIQSYKKAAGVVSKGNGDCFLMNETHPSLTTGGGQAGQGYPCVLQSDTLPLKIQDHAYSVSIPFSLS